MAPDLLEHVTPSPHALSDHVGSNLATTGTKDDVPPDASNRNMLLSEEHNPCLKVTADRTIKMSTNPVRAPNHDQVLLHIKCTGVCGSDIHFWRAGGIGPLKVLSDCILGHEASGVVLRVGSSVKSLSVGDRVAVEPGVPCGDCYLCQQGSYNLCEEVQFAGVWP
jgi:L-iditol 2-dehydrogenase